MQDEFFYAKMIAMEVLKTNGWEEYCLLDTGNELRLERFGNQTIVRPDPQAIWQPHLTEREWADADFVFGEKGWENRKNLPSKWKMTYKSLSFFAKLSPFKHTGVFPEQHLQWDFVTEQIVSAHRPISVLNLFAYTGIASLVAAAAGAKVTHVDASAPTIGWARDNQALSGLEEKPIRWILDDAIKFTAREWRREVRYDAIIMDPPAYGHGPHGETWDFHKSVPLLLDNCKKILSSSPLFIIINAYAISSSALMLKNVLADLHLGGTIEEGELALQEKDTDRLLSTGIFARWTNSTPKK